MALSCYGHRERCKSDHHCGDRYAQANVAWRLDMDSAQEVAALNNGLDTLARRGVSGGITGRSI